MSAELWRGLAGFGAAAIVALAAYRARALTADGAVAATVVGGLAVAGAGWGGGLLLVLFFVTGSVLSRMPVRSAAAVSTARGARRDAVQVGANGGIAALLAALMPILGPPLAAVLVAGYAGAIAAATADTWATELGRRFGGTPRSITSGRPVAVGASGGVTAIGLLGSVAGALLIAGVATWLAPLLPGGSVAVAPLAVAAGGLAGSLGDSLLGATVQARYRCPACERFTESPRHSCGTPAILTCGHPLVTNDAVNLAATAIGAAVAAIVVAWG